MPSTQHAPRCMEGARTKHSAWRCHDDIVTVIVEACSELLGIVFAVLIDPAHAASFLCMQIPKDSHFFQDFPIPAAPEVDVAAKTPLALRRSWYTTGGGTLNGASGGSTATSASGTAYDWSTAGGAGGLSGAGGATLDAEGC